jgi:hypothetical protein
MYAKNFPKRLQMSIEDTQPIMICTFRITITITITSSQLLRISQVGVWHIVTDRTEGKNVGHIGKHLKWESEA